MLGFLVFWLLVMGVLYWAMQMYLKPAGVKVQADGTVAIARDRDGHFRVEGAVNGQPVTFLVDTGASMVGVTEPLAERAGLDGGEPVRFRTANGERDGRMVVAEQVRVARWWSAACAWARAIPAAPTGMRCWARTSCAISMWKYVATAC
jgi:aspartyl protease family protein